MTALIPWDRTLENHNPLDLIEAELVAPAIVELRRTRRAWFALAAAFSSVPPFLRYR
jgi:hypothetical protein